MPLRIVFGDITKLKVDAIVNAANSKLAPGGGVCGAIFKAAGYNKLKDACEKIGHCETGSAVITSGFNLESEYIIHAVGPVYSGFREDELLLSSAYKSSLALGIDHGINSIAFPLISSGIYGYPLSDAYRVAVETIYEFLQDYELDVYMVIFNKNFETFTDTSTIEAIKEKLLEMESSKEEILSKRITIEGEIVEKSTTDLQSLLNSKSSSEIFETIKDFTNLPVKSNLNSKRLREIFSGSTPTRNEILSIAYGANLNRNDTYDLLDAFDEYLSPFKRRDVVLDFLLEKNYRVIDINDILIYFSEEILN